jgi:hypothetical protein
MPSRRDVAAGAGPQFSGPIYLIWRKDNQSPLLQKFVAQVAMFLLVFRRGSLSDPLPCVHPVANGA